MSENPLYTAVERMWRAEDKARIWRERAEIATALLAEQIAHELAAEDRERVTEGVDVP